MVGVGLSIISRLSRPRQFGFPQERHREAGNRKRSWGRFVASARGYLYLSRRQESRWDIATKEPLRDGKRRRKNGGVGFVCSVGAILQINRISFVPSFLSRHSLLWNYIRVRRGSHLLISGATVLLIAECSVSDWKGTQMPLFGISRLITVKEWGLRGKLRHENLGPSCAYAPTQRSRWNARVFCHCASSEFYVRDRYSHYILLRCTVLTLTVAQIKVSPDKGFDDNRRAKSWFIQTLES